MVSVSLPTLILVLVVCTMILVIVLIRCVMSLQLIMVIIKYLRQTDELGSVRDVSVDVTLLSLRRLARQCSCWPHQVARLKQKGTADVSVPDPNTQNIGLRALNVLPSPPATLASYVALCHPPPIGFIYDVL